MRFLRASGTLLGESFTASTMSGICGCIRWSCCMFSFFRRFLSFRAGKYAPVAGDDVVRARGRDGQHGLRGLKRFDYGRLQPAGADNQGRGGRRGAHLRDFAVCVGLCLFWRPEVLRTFSAGLPRGGGRSSVWRCPPCLRLSSSSWGRSASGTGCGYAKAEKSAASGANGGQQVRRRKKRRKGRTVWRCSKRFGAFNGFPGLWNLPVKGPQKGLLAGRFCAAFARLLP